MDQIGHFAMTHRWSLGALTLGLMVLCHQHIDYESTLKSECRLYKETPITASALTCMKDCKPVVERVYACEIGMVTIRK